MDNKAIQSLIDHIEAFKLRLAEVGAIQQVLAEQARAMQRVIDTEEAWLRELQGKSSNGDGDSRA